MTNTSSPLVHPTALISPEARLAEDVRVGAFAIIEGSVILGSGCVIGPQARLIGPMKVGSDNQIFQGAVLGECPQHLGDRGQGTSVEIGDRNIFREYVTIHRGTNADRGVTRIGNENFFMVSSHIAHDCIIGNNCVLANGALVGGHCILQDRVLMSGNCAVQQHTRLGRLSMIGGVSGCTRSLPPFVVINGHNLVVGINLIGMRRAGHTTEEINGAKKAFHLIYREGNLLGESLKRIEDELGDQPLAMEMVSFIREEKRGIKVAPTPPHRQAS